MALRGEHVNLPGYIVTIALPTAMPSWGHTKRFLAAFYFLAVLSGLKGGIVPEPTATDLLLSLSLAVSMGWWAIVDARLRNRPIPMSARAWFVLLAWIVVPIFVIWSRRWRGVGWVLASGACW
jgi:hypothetical protein